MITTSAKPNFQYLRKLMVLPVAAIVVLLFAFKYAKKNTNHVAESAMNLNGLKEIVKSDTSKVDLDKIRLLKKSLVFIDGVKQLKRGLLSVDSTLFFNKLETMKVLTGKAAILRYGEEGKDGVVEIIMKSGVDLNSGDTTKPKYDSVVWIKTRDVTPHAKKSPTMDELQSWCDEKMYGVWLDGMRISNHELTKYRPDNFADYNVSKLTKNAVNYGKHFYQVSLYSPAYFEKGMSENSVSYPFLVRGTSQYDTTGPIKPEPLIVIDGKIMPELKFRGLDSLISPSDIESVTVLKDRTATYKYGEKAKYGVLEIITKKGEVREAIRWNKEATAEADDNKVFEKVEIECTYPGGVNAWRNFLASNLNPKVTANKGIKNGTYTVIVQFIVDKTGNVSNIKALTNHGFGMEEESIRVVQSSGKWNPAVQNGHIVKAYRRQPINFVVVDK